jgi:hypothetical protein
MSDAAVFPACGAVYSSITKRAIIAPSAVPAIPAPRDGEWPVPKESRALSLSEAAGHTRSGCAYAEGELGGGPH